MSLSAVDYAQIISAIAASLAAIVAAYTAYQSRQAALEIRQDTKRRRRPRVGMYLAPSARSNSFAQLVVKNYGGSVALDLRFRLAQDIEINFGGKQKLSDYLLFSKGLKALYPDQVKEQFFMSVLGRDESFFTTPIEVLVSYLSEEGERYEEKLYLDFTALPEFSTTSKDIQDVVRELERLRRVLERKK